MSVRDKNKTNVSRKELKKKLKKTLIKTVAIQSKETKTLFDKNIE